METAESSRSGDFMSLRRLLFLAAALLLAGFSARGQSLEPTTGTAIARDLLAFRELGGVLFVAAHPDDENTQLIAHLARGRHYRTAYLSVTRGDGGQNLLGPEFGDELGLIRTQELLAARRIDGGRQFFTRAIDFGYSKSPDETLRIWGKEAVLGDVVRVIRQFQPDVVIARFSPQPGRTHGHHTASAMLALEAFKLAGDPKAYPGQLGGRSTPWQPKRILVNAGGGGRGGGGGTGADVLRIDIGGNDPLTGESLAAIAGRSRSMHKTQGFGNFGGRGGGGSRPESFQLLAGEPAGSDLLDGVDTTWGRYPGGAEIGRLIDDAIDRFDPQHPSAGVPALLEVKSRLAALPAGIVLDEKRRLLDHILAECLGLTVESVTPRPEIVPGETMPLRQTALLRANFNPVRWVGARFPGEANPVGEAMDLRPNQPATREATRTLPADTPLTQPYWLREAHPTGTFHVAEPNLMGQPENPPPYPIEEIFEVAGQRIVLSNEPVSIASLTGASAGEVSPAIPRKLEVIAPVALKFVSNFEFAAEDRPALDAEVFHPGERKLVHVEIAARHPNTKGTVALQVPEGWKVDPPHVTFDAPMAGQRLPATFQVTAPAQPVTAQIAAVAEVGGKRYDTGRVEIRYDHIPPQLLQPPARAAAVSLDLKIRGTRIGYLPGAGDSVAACLEQMGCTVKTLSGTDLTTDGLRGLDAVVIGVRAINVRDDLSAGLPALFAFVHAGGNVIEQYNRPDRLPPGQFAPYSLRLSGSRVTDETAPVTFLAPEHPALNTPNKITSADFDGWVQERGIYYPDQWDEHWTPILAAGDPGEAPLNGGLLVAPYGKGWFVYTGLVFFRQLPAGVPGAYRLFANLVSLGKD